MASVNKAARVALINDLKDVARKNKGQQVTRNLYRALGRFSESAWQAYFPRFKDFLAAAEIGTTPEQPEQPETNEYKDQGNTWNVSLPKTRIHTLDELLDYCQVDRLLWSVESFLVNKWEMGAKDKDTGKLIGQPLFQVKATLKKRKEVQAIFDEITKMKEDAKTWAPLPSPIARAATSRSGNMLEVDIPDAHLAKLAWALETGYQNYDTAIAIETFYRAVETIISRTSHFKFDKILFIVGNDLLQADNQESETYSGTRVDTDSRYKKTFTKARVMLATAIERLRQIAPVKVIVVPGNHDRLSSWHIGELLAMQFTNYSDVEVDNSPTNRKYHQHGKVMLGFTHGDQGKRQDYPLLAATEQPLMWGQTTFREIHTGHYHATKTEEYHGVRVRILPALCPPDAWHSEGGLVGNQRNAEGYVWHETQGLITQVFHNEDAYEVAA